MRTWVGIYVRLGIWRRGNVWPVAHMRRHLVLVMVLRAGMGQDKDYAGLVLACGWMSCWGKRNKRRTGG
jgi:hypothetical protein